MRRRYLPALGLVVAAAVAVGEISGGQAINPVAQAATATLGSGGYKMSAQVTVTGGSAPFTATMKGVIDARTHSGKMDVSTTIDGREIQVPVLFSDLGTWTRIDSLPSALQNAGGKPWAYIDMDKSLTAMGLSALPSTLDPSRFLDYLRAARASTTKLGTLMIHTVQTTEYRTVVSLDRYADMQGAAVSSSVVSLEQAIGSHSLPVDAWLDAKHRVRRMQISVPECIAGQQVHLSLTMGIYGFGTRVQVHPPSRKQVFNLTHQLAAAEQQVPLGGC